MIKHNQDGAVNGLALSLILAVILLIASMGFGYWAYAGRQDYKNNSDAKVAVAVSKAKAAESTLKDQQFAEEQKNPLSTYNAPNTVGSLVIKYPKTWSVYIADAGSGSSTTFNAYFNPPVVPPVGDRSSVYALQVQVVGKPYSQAIGDYGTQVREGRMTATAYALPLVPKVVGTEFSGTLSDGSKVTMVILPLRSQSIELTTQGTQFISDFNNYILKNFSFSP